MSRDLLRPSISQDRANAVALYSPGAIVVPAFFGGPIAAAIMFGLNVDRAGRWNQDGWLVVLGGIAHIIAPLFSTWLGFNEPIVMRNSYRVAGLLIAGIYIWRHRELQRIQELFGSDRPSPWGIGIAAILAGGLAAFLAGAIWKT